MRVAGIIVLTCGVVGTLASGRLSRWFATHFRLTRGSPAPKPEQVEGTRRFLVVVSTFGALLLIAVGALWIAGIGTK
jgi:hypothetical protein